MTRSSNEEVVELELIRPGEPAVPARRDAMKGAVTKVELTVEIFRFLRSHTLFVIIVVALVSTGALSLAEIAGILNLGSAPAAAAPPTEDAQVPEAVPYRLFEEYPHVRADMRAIGPRGCSASIWVGFRHLPPSQRQPWIDRWSRAPGWREVAPGAGIYHVDCGGSAAGEFKRLMEGYPYGIAPGAKTEASWAKAYEEVGVEAGFSVPVLVRGDWLLAAASPAFARQLGLSVTKADADQWRAESLDPAWVFGESPASGRLAESGPPTRKRLEATTVGRGSLFVQWAQKAGLASPRF